MTETLGLTVGELTFAVAAVFFAGLIRGFTGFALSAVIVAALVTMIAPVELIPICMVLELSSSVLLLRGGIRDADKAMALRLQGGAMVGTPLGLWLTNTVAPDLSRGVALGLVLGLSAAQLLRVRLPVSSAPFPTIATGMLSGFVSGLANIGGMIVALYTLSLGISPRQMRGTLILIIFLGGTLSIFWQSLFGMFTATALSRAAFLTVPTLLGVLLGRHFFSPDYERFYRPAVLGLLIALALVNLVRLVL